MSSRTWVATSIASCVVVFFLVLGSDLGWFPAGRGGLPPDGHYVLVHGEVDGLPVSGLTIDIDAALVGSWDGSPISGFMLCNHVNGQAWDELLTTLVGCELNGGTPDQGDPPDPPGRWPEGGVLQALRDGPRIRGDRIVFEIDGVRLVYERQG